MDVIEQVNKIIKDAEAKEYQNWKQRRLEEGLALSTLVANYNRYVALRNWNSANDCLLNISRLVVVMLGE